MDGFLLHGDPLLVDLFSGVADNNCSQVETKRHLFGCQPIQMIHFLSLMQIGFGWLPVPPGAGFATRELLKMQIYVVNT